MNRIKEIENIIDRKENEIKDYKSTIKNIDEQLYNYKQSVSAGVKISAISGLLITLILNCIEQAIFGVPGSSPFTVMLPSTMPVVIISTLNMIPLFLGIKGAINAPKKIEREMNININELKQDRLSHECLISCNKKDIDELTNKLEEANYILGESCVNYADIEDVLIYSEDKEKVKVLKIDKKL